MNSSQPNFCRGSQAKVATPKGAVRNARCPQRRRVVPVSGRGVLRNHSSKGV